MMFHVEGKYAAKYETKFFPKVSCCFVFAGMKSAQQQSSKVSKATERWAAIKQSISVLCIIDPVLLGQKNYLKITRPEVTW